MIRELRREMGAAMAVRLGIDTRGTFTDLMGIDDVTGELVVAKTLSMRSRPVDAMMNAIA